MTFRSSPTKDCRLVLFISLTIVGCNRTLNTDTCMVNGVGGMSGFDPCPSTGGTWGTGGSESGLDTDGGVVDSGPEDPVNCSECLTNNGGCDPLTTCVNVDGGHTCGACPAGYTGTGSSGCVDINECLTNNGGCDTSTTCANAPGGSTCCKQFYADCNNDATDGCETMLAQDGQNCGSCGHVCAVTTTSIGQCGWSAGGVSAMCISCDYRGPTRHYNCDLDVSNGCEVDAWIDNNNCGGCGIVCPVGTACVGPPGTCVPLN